MKDVYNSPFTSILILYWNNAKYITHCLEHLAKQTVNDFEVVIIDNGSKTDAILDLIGPWPQLTIQIHHSTSNLGFSIANNIGTHLSRGKWIALLNADAYPEPEWLEHLLKAAETNPEYSSFTSRQIQYNVPEFLDGTGDIYHISGLAWRNDYQLPSQAHGLTKKEVFSACGAAALYSREAFLDVGGFDEDYFSYFEDVDLGFRLRLSGDKCLYVPEAVVYHVGSASTEKRSDFSVYYGYRNMIWTFFKNMPSPLIWFFLPLHVVTVMFFVFYLTLRGQGRVILKAVVDAIRGLPKILEKRKEVQRNIKIDPFKLLDVMSTGLMEPYREFIQRNRMK